jgi:SAM-dependent methyltransferase
MANGVVESPNHLQCDFCGSLFRVNVPDASFRFDWDQKYFSNERVINYYRGRVSAFEKLVEMMLDLTAPPRRWLDVGCGIGVLLGVASKAGWEVCGIEGSHSCAEIARKSILGIDLREGPILEQLKELPNTFSVVSLTDTLRYLKYPQDVLRHAHNVLAEGGWVLVRELNASKYRKRLRNSEASGNIDFLSDLQLWSPSALELTLSAAGFKSVKSLPSPVFVEIARLEKDRGSRIGDRLKLLGKRAVAYADQIVHRVSSGLIYLGPNYITIGQKQGSSLRST